MYCLLNLMSVSGVSLTCVVSVLGYCLLPIVALSGVSVLFSLAGLLGNILTGAAVCWCAVSSSKVRSPDKGGTRMRSEAANCLAEFPHYKTQLLLGYVILSNYTLTLHKSPPTEIIVIFTHCTCDLRGRCQPGHLCSVDVSVVCDRSGDEAPAAAGGLPLRPALRRVRPHHHVLAAQQCDNLQLSMCVY